MTPVMSLADEMNQAADQLVTARPDNDVVQRQADWLRCAARLVAGKPAPWQEVLASRGTQFDASLGYALLLARSINTEYGKSQQ